jgi:acyl-CoA synthetase (AMP-forming)/AMP-acid ligase II
VVADTIPALLALNATDRGRQEAIVDQRARIDYAGLDLSSGERAAWLVAQGVNRHHRVGLLMENGLDWVINACAVMRLGATLVPLSTLLRASELADQLAIAGVRHLIATPAFRGRDYRAEIAGLDRQALPSLRDIWWHDELGSGDAQDVQMARAMEARITSADDLAVIFTSGSSGTPKGVVHTQGAAIRATRAGLAARCIRAGTRLYLPMPFFWIGGFGGGLISSLVAGATLLTEAEPEPGGTLAFLARERASLFRGWPDQARRIAAHRDFARTDLSALAPGSLDALLPEPLQADPGARANLFGMTETFGPYCGYPLDRELPDSKRGSCGQTFAGIALRIVDAETSAVLEPGRTGKIQLGGTNILRAICGREREDVFSSDGWYDGGDLGWLDADGFLFFAGRADDMVKVRGASVYPAEVERALEAIPGVARAYATAIDCAGEVFVGAAVVVDPGSSMGSDRLAQQAKEQLSAFKLPRRWLIVPAIDDVPHTPSGKIDRQALRTLLEAADMEQPE